MNMSLPMLFAIVITLYLGIVLFAIWLSEDHEKLKR